MCKIFNQTDLGIYHSEWMLAVQPKPWGIVRKCNKIIRGLEKADLMETIKRSRVTGAWQGGIDD